MQIEGVLVGTGALLLGLILTFAMPVGARRVNQTLIAVLIAVMFVVAGIAFAPLLGFPAWLIAAVVVAVVAILIRDVRRFVKHVYYDVTKYSRRDFWYRRVGEAVLGGGRRSSRRRSRR
jgi:hypothetical protein